MDFAQVCGIVFHLHLSGCRALPAAAHRLAPRQIFEQRTGDGGVMVLKIKEVHAASGDQTFLLHPKQLVELPVVAEDSDAGFRVHASEPGADRRIFEGSVDGLVVGPDRQVQERLGLLKC
ncbi:hypothetical protein D3C71_1239300 [compost metagenome]